MESTIKNPFAFFETYITDGGLEKHLSKFLYEITEYSGLHITSLDNTKGVVKYYDVDIFGNTVEETTSFESELTKLIYKQIKISKNLINEGVTESVTSSSDYIAYLMHQEKQLQYIIRNGKENIEKYPILLSPFKEIIKYINQKHLNKAKKEIVLNMSFLEFNQPTDTILDDYELILAVIGYLKGNNDKRQKIMTDDQFDLMHSCIIFYKENEKMPVSIQKLDPINISKDLLLFTFWVLHKHLYTTKTIRKSFIELIKFTFSDFDDWELTTLKAKFGNKSKLNPYRARFASQIIINELRSS
ncbi:hypothetical protein [Flavobacterium sp.]|uniref:hypothetical protein n=1 Tax=Flavobacterium sp. TaxID=239 RepID=UPI0028BD9F55|nr:hypothetical protein [Flavobacterium sp.]